MQANRYLKDIVQTNGVRVWTNPLSNIKFPKGNIEIFITGLPEHLTEIDILPHFERFGPIYQFRLLIDYNGENRGFSYLTYFYNKNALECMDCMGYFLITPGIMLEVARSEERSHLIAINIPSQVNDEDIEREFRLLYHQAEKVFVKRDAKEICKAILAFPDHESALAAKRWSGVGSVHLWGRNIKVLWAKNQQIEDLKEMDEDVKHVLIHNVPEYLDVEEFGEMMCTLVSPLEIISIRPMQTDWMVEFSSTQAARTIFERFQLMEVENQCLQTEWVTHGRLKEIPTFADFDFELRCFCIANYWDPPIFIYGRILPNRCTQLCSVIIKNNRNNSFTTFFIEMSYKHLVEIHARVCELLMLIFIETKELPKKNLVINCFENFATIVGEIVNMYEPKLIKTSPTMFVPISLPLDEVFALSILSYELIASDIDEVYKEYKFILKEKNIHHQLIGGIFNSDNVLGCIDPIYRRGKPLKYQTDPRQMIFAMCDKSLSNFDLAGESSIYKIEATANERTFRLKFDKVEMIPISAVQRENVHYTYRPYIQFDRVDTFGPLFNILTSRQQQNEADSFSLAELMNFLPM